MMIAVFVAEDAWVTATVTREGEGSLPRSPLVPRVPLLFLPPHLPRPRVEAYLMPPEG